MSDYIFPPDALKDTFARADVQPPFDPGRNVKARIYSTPGRVVMLDAEDDTTLYGIARDDLVVRAAPPDAKLLKIDALQQALKALLPGMATELLRLDERDLLGLLPEDDHPIVALPDHQTCRLLGEIDLTTLSPGLVLRPTGASFTTAGNPKTLCFVERRTTDPLGGEAPLVVDLRPAALDQKMPHAQTLKTRVSLLLDEKVDGGWEVTSPLWMRTTEGFLRVTADGKQDATKTVGYGLTQETRQIDATAWFDQLPSGTRVALLLDRSGEKTLTVKGSDARNVSATLEIASPAFVIMLPGVTCDSGQLVDPIQPPGREAMRQGTLLHLVTAGLRPPVGPAWTLVAGGADGKHAARLTLSTTDKASVTRFARCDDLVRPPEVAINDGPGMSEVRVLMPHLPQDVLIEIQETGLETANPLPGVDWGKAAALGPVARFTVRADLGCDIDKEKTGPAGNETTYPNQPAVLRPTYRDVPGDDTRASDATIDGPRSVAMAPFTTTYTWPETPGAAAATTYQEYGLAMQADALRWRIDDKGTVRRRRSRLTNTAGENDFGWWDVQRFLHMTRTLPPPPTATRDGRLEWLELTKDNGGWVARAWLRLGDDSLASQAVVTVPAAVGDDDHVVAALRAAAASHEPWSLESKPLHAAGDSSSGGLAFLSLLETDAGVAGSTFALQLQKDGVALTVPVERPQPTPVGNRLVLATAAQVMNLNLTVDGVTFSALNRLYLELERFGAAFRVRRGMLGWTAAKAFGFQADGDLQVTEFFDTDIDGRLQRTVEFNGAATGPVVPTDAALPSSGANMLRTPIDALEPYALKLYFWSSELQTANGLRRLRVICKHSFTEGDRPYSICALQDAIVRDDWLDLSADIAILGSYETPGEARSADDVWQPTRRSLFGVKLDARAERVLQPVAILKLRHIGRPSVFRQGVATTTRRPTIVPAWEVGSSNIAPWFTADEQGRRARPSWLRQRAELSEQLRTAVPATSPELSVQLYRLLDEDGLNRSGLRACTLVGAQSHADGESEPVSGIPQWIPSPIRSILSPPAVTPKPNVAQYRLWLFDPRRRVIGEWLDGARNNDEVRSDARATLVRLGWTREAVLECTPAGLGTATTWTVLDSPLLNRDAGLAWFGWPLGAGPNRPQESWSAMPDQVVHLAAPAFTSVGVHVPFNSQRQGDGTMWLAPQVFMPTFDTAASITHGFGPVEFRAQQLRVGVPHALVIHGSRAKPTFIAAKAPPLPPDPQSSLARVDDSTTSTWVSWASATVTLSDVLTTNDIGVYQLRLNSPVAATLTRVTIIAAPAGLCVKALSDSRWQVAMPDLEIVFPQAADKLVVRMPNGERWSTIRLMVHTTAVVGTPTQNEARSFFVADQDTADLAGLFIDGNLQAFGSEVPWFESVEGPLDAGSPSIWTQCFGLAIKRPDPDLAIHVARIDAMGLVTVHQMAAHGVAALEY